jgi:predicted ester cyclase
MSDQNKSTTRRFYEEVFNQKKLATVDELCSPTFVDHNPGPGQAPGPQGLKTWLQQLFQAFPDLTATIDEMIAERDLVVTRLTCHATHKGAFMGAAPTGKKVTFTSLDMVRMKDGRATEVWHEGNDAAVLMQLGAHVPAAT